MRNKEIALVVRTSQYRILIQQMKGLDWVEPTQQWNNVIRAWNNIVRLVML